jgi:hypothetical protein
MPGARGEAILTLPDGEQRAILFTSRALVDAEDVLGISGIALYKRVAKNQEMFEGSGHDAQLENLAEVSVGETVWLLQIGMEYARRDTKSRPQPFTRDDAYAVIDQLGYLTVVGPVVRAFFRCWGYTIEKEQEQGNPPLPVGKDQEPLLVSKDQGPA